MLTLSFPETDIALVSINDPNKGANVLSGKVLDELSAILDQLEKRKGLAGVIFISAKAGNFIAGADLREFVASIDAPAEEVAEFSRRGQHLFARLAKLPAVSIAAIDGACLGGGAELAVWCDRRIVADNPKTQFGFPEVKLGLYPGWGGTARTPRMIGLYNAIELVTAGESLDAQSTYRMGLAQDIVPSDRLQSAAIAMVRAEQLSSDYLRDRERYAAPIVQSDTELAFLGATASAYIQQQTKGFYPAPIAALEVMLGAAGMPIDEALEAEATGFPALFGSEVNRALLNVFFLQDANKKDTGVANDATPRAVEAVSVIGAGVMGQGIAAANVRRKIPVRINDVRREALAKAMSAVIEEVSYNKATKGPDAAKAVEFAPYVTVTANMAEIAASDLVIEAVVENVDVKKQVLGDLEKALGKSAILASNTSTIPITRLAAGLARPEQFVGIHFFNPVRKMPLVEVIRGEKTSDETVATAVAYAKRLGKSPIVVRDAPGFLVNRLLLPYMNEALLLVGEGASLKSVDRAATAFGMPMGPITLYDVVGLDVALFAGHVMHEAFPDRTVESPILAALHGAGRLGQKNKKGFFSYDNRRGKAEPDAAVEQLIAGLRSGQKKHAHDEMSMRLFLPMVLEATRVLAEQVVRTPQDVDLGLIYGIGFPPFRGGLLFWADTLGAQGIVDALKPFASLGARYQPTPLLLEMAKTGKKFYPQPKAALQGVGK